MSNDNHVHNYPGYERKKSGENNFLDEPYGRTRRFAENARGGGSRGGGYKRTPRQGISVTMAVFIDILLAALIMLIFYLTNYAWPGEIKPKPLPTPTTSVNNTAVPSPTLSGTAPSATSTASADTASWRTKFADKFTDGEVIKTDTSYKSANINVSVSKKQDNGATYYIADIYVADLKYFKTGFAKKVDKIAYRESTPTIAKEYNAVIAINGDLCLDNDGLILRNGQYYKDQKAADQLVMYYDGSMQTFSADELDRDKIKTGGANVYQVWTFGPMLLKDGQPMTDFTSPQKIAGSGNPRTAVGYYEPGHYCFLVVDGRQPGYSNGYSCKQMSQLFYNLGCTVAFNLDGGQSSEMAFEGSFVNQPYKGGRSTSDIIYIADE